MRRIVFSKQADHDAPMFPFWYHWYTNVFRADLVILTPVKTETSCISKTCDFYRRFPKVIIRPIHIPKWHPPKIWRQQKKIVKEHLDEQHFLALAADSDEFFEFVYDQPADATHVTFRQVNICAEQPPSVTELAQIPMSCTMAGYKAAYVGTLEGETVGIMGHVRKQSNKKMDLLMFHYLLRGFESFLYQTEQANLDERLPDRISHHWRERRNILSHSGEAALREKYIELGEKIRRGGTDQRVLSRFLNPCRPQMTE